MSRAGIIGLGLVGGSLARDLRAAGWSVLGTDDDGDSEAAALEAGVIEGEVDAAAVDVIVLAVPLHAVPLWLEELAGELSPRSDVVISDVSSTKRSVLAAAVAAGLGSRFVGAHPMAGHHRSGWSASREGMFRDAPVWICPSAGAAPRRVEQVESLWRAVGGIPRRIEAASHDRLLARSSHLPQLVATAVAVALERAGVEPDELGPGGRGTTRLAASDPALWTEILLDNADEVGPAIDSLGGILLGIRKALRLRDAAALRGVLEAGREWRIASPPHSPRGG